MPRLMGVDIPANKKLEFSLQYIYGVGPKRAKGICDALKLNPDSRAKDLSDEEVKKIVDFIQASYKTEGELRRDVASNIRRLIEIKSYRGSRHRKNLPCRGQRSKTNCRTRKGPRARMAGAKKPAAKA